VAAKESAGPGRAAVLNHPDARERLLAAAYELFSHQGIQAVGIDAIIERSGVARQTMYRHFDSKQELVVAFLERRDELWTRRWLQSEVQQRASDPEQQLLAIFDVLDRWFHAPDFEGCSFIKVMLEHPAAAHPLHRASAAYLERIRDFIEALARRAGIADATSFGREWHVLMNGSIVAAGEGDLDAARRAQKIARLVLEDATRETAAQTAAARTRRRRPAARMPR